MSEKKGPFDAVIGVLRIMRGADYLNGTQEFASAIRVLEAAGKVDKRDAVHTISLLAENWYETSGEYGEGPDVESNEIMKPSVENIRALLEALSDGGRKEE